MAAYRAANGGYEWELTLHPDTAAALLSAVCVDETPGRPNPHWLGHLLWGPKSWSIEFDGPKFRLYPLGRGNMKRFGLPHGTIQPTKLGSRLTLHGDGDDWILRVVGVLMPVFALVIGLSVFIPQFAPERFWLGVIVVAAFVGWAAFAGLWLLPYSYKHVYLDFIDDLFAEQIITPEKKSLLHEDALPKVGSRG